jgi:hypothetical protein
VRSSDDSTPGSVLQAIDARVGVLGPVVVCGASVRRPVAGQIAADSQGPSPLVSNAIRAKNARV